MGSNNYFTKVSPRIFLIRIFAYYVCPTNTILQVLVAARSLQNRLGGPVRNDFGKTDNQGWHQKTKPLKSKNMKDMKKPT